MRRARRSHGSLAQHDILTIDRVEPMIEQMQHRLGGILVVGEAMQQFAAGGGRLGRQPGGEIEAQLRALDIAPARIKLRRPGEGQGGFRHIAAAPQQMSVMQRKFRITGLGAAGALGGIERAVEPAAQHLGAGQNAPKPRGGGSRRSAAQQARRICGAAAAHQHLGGVDHGPELAPLHRRGGAHRPLGRLINPAPIRQQRCRMKREFRIVRRQYRGGRRRRDCLIDTSRRRQSTAQMAPPLDPIRRKLDKPAIGVGGLAMAVAIAEDPGANTQQRRIAPDLQKAAAGAGKRILAPPPVQ